MIVILMSVAIFLLAILGFLIHLIWKELSKLLEMF